MSERKQALSRYDCDEELGGGQGRPNASGGAVRRRQVWIYACEARIRAIISHIAAQAPKPDSGKGLGPTLCAVVIVHIIMEGY